MENQIANSHESLKAFMKSKQFNRISEKVRLTSVNSIPYVKVGNENTSELVCASRQAAKSGLVAEGQSYKDVLGVKVVTLSNGRNKFAVAEQPLIDISEELK